MMLLVIQKDPRGTTQLSVLCFYHWELKWCPNVGYSAIMNQVHLSQGSAIEVRKLDVRSVIDKLAYFVLTKLTNRQNRPSLSKTNKFVRA